MEGQRVHPGAAGLGERAGRAVRAGDGEPPVVAAGDEALAVARGDQDAGVGVGGTAWVSPSRASSTTPSVRAKAAVSFSQAQDTTWAEAATGVTASARDGAAVVVIAPQCRAAAREGEGLGAVTLPPPRGRENLRGLATGRVSPCRPRRVG
jgi:hypothetical protein